MRFLGRGSMPAVCFVIVAISGVLAAEKPEGSAPVVRYEKSMLTVEAHDVPLDVLLKAVAKESGAELVGAPRNDRPVTIALKDVSMKEALERLVGEQNFTLKYGDAGALKAIELRGGHQDPEVRAKPDPDNPTAEGNTTPPKWVAFYRSFNYSEKLPVSDDLREACAGKEAVGWDYMGNTAIAAKDPKVRREAVRTIMNGLNQDPDTKAAVIASLTAMNDEELATFARKTTYFRAEDLVRNVLREIDDQELRDRARGVLHQLHKNPYQGPYFDPH